MSNRKKENMNAIVRYLPEKLRKALLMIEETSDELCEIRLRADCPVVLVFIKSKGFFTQSGRFTSIYNNNVLKIDSREVTTTFEKMCNYSVYSFSNNICDGFLTLENGCRVGVYGTAVVQKDKIVSVRNIKGMNIRLAGQHDGVADDLLSLFRGVNSNVLICGPPGCGKTTVLKDLARKLSDELSLKTAVVDERYEFENYYLGYNTDVLSGYPKSEGIQISVRTLSPEIVICDEIGTTGEVESIRYGLNSGVSFVLSMHCKNRDELMKKNQFRMLAQANVIDYVAFLGDKSGVSQVYEIKELCDECNSIDFYRSGVCTCGKLLCP